MGRSIRDYFFEKLVFPKAIKINSPGIIINRVMSRYGGVKSQQRSVLFFEDILVGLQKRTIDALGNQEASDMWYEIGKKVSTRYLLLSHTSKVNNFLLKPVLTYIFSGFAKGGQSFAERVFIDTDNMVFRFEGSDNILCRKTANGNFCAGVVSGIVSFVTGKNIEALTSCNCSKKCKILLDIKNEKRYVPNLNDLSPSVNYNKFNFSGKIASGRSCSFGDLIKFDEVRMIGGKWNYGGKFLIPGEVGMLGIVDEAFSKRGIEDLFRSGVIEESEVLARSIFSKKDIGYNLKKMTSLFSALGMGIIYHSKSDNGFCVNIKCPPYSKYGFGYIAYVINGFLNVAMDRKFLLKNEEFDGWKLTLSFS